MRGLIASPFGYLIGLSLGALGGGGSILAVPVLVYVAGQGTKAATATSLVIVGLTAIAGLGPHLRAGRVRLVPGVLFGLAGVGGSFAGTALNKHVDPDVLLLAFAGIMLIAAAAMWRRARPRIVSVDGEPAAAVAVRTASRVDVATVVRVVLLGSVVGLLTGFFGVGGGFVIVPALVLALGFEMPVAAATSLVVIAINSATALILRAASGSLLLEWQVIVPFLIAGAVGVFHGSRLAGKVAPDRLQRSFAVLLVAVAVYTAARSGLALLT